MLKSLLKKLSVIIMCSALAAGTAVFISACGDKTPDTGDTGSGNENTGNTGSGNENTGNENTGNENNGNESAGGSATKYYFEAEYTDLTDLTGDPGSSTLFNKGMIAAGERAHEGYYVSTFNVVGSTITFTVNAEAAATVNMSLLLRAEAEGTMDSELLDIKVNGTAVNYDAVTVKSETEKVSAIKTNKIFGEIAIGEVQLNAGANNITFTVGEKSNASGSGTYKYTFEFDAMVLTSETALTWSPITDWDSFYPDF